MRKIFTYHLSLITYHLKSGQLLIEILIAIGLSAIILPALLTGLVSSREGKAQEGQRLQATAYLREAEEAVRSIREKGWSNISANGTYHPELSGSSWSLVTGSESISGYTRQIVISDTQRDSSGNLVETGGTIDLSTKKAVITVSWTTPQTSSISTTNYYQRYLGNAAFNHTSQADFNGGSHTNTTAADVPGSVVLTQSSGPSTDYGNKFLVTATSSIGNMTSSAMKSSMRFTAQKSATVNAIRVYLNAEVGTSPTYRYGIQNNSGGNPSGTYLGSGTLVTTSAGWKIITLSPAVTITAGNTYHIVVEYASGTISTSRYVALRRSTPQNLLYPQTQTADTQSNTLFNSGSGWTTQNFQPIYELDFSDVTYEGNPYETNAQVNIFGANWIGERFTVTGGNKTANSISFFVRQNSATEPLDSLQVELRTVSPNAAVSGGGGVLATAAQTNTTYAYFTYTFASAITLTNGTAYRIILKSPSSNSTNFYQVYRIVTTNAANYTSISYDGTNSIYTVSANSGSSWTDTNNNWDIGGFYFTVQGTTTYSSLGEFISHSSGSFDTGVNDAAFNNITWTAPSVPVGTTLGLQVAISNTNPPTTFVGPDGTSATQYTTSPATITPFNAPGGRYIRYKAIFTSNGSATPRLDDVSINYSP